jgi:hypothetical protein
MIGLLCFVLASPFKSKLRLQAGNAMLRHQLIVLRRRLPGRVRFTNNDRWFFIQLYRWFPSILKVPHPRSRPDLWQRRHAPIALHGHPGQAHRISLALAEWLCRTADRINPA